MVGRFDALSLEVLHIGPASIGRHRCNKRFEVLLPALEC